MELQQHLPTQKSPRYRYLTVCSRDIQPDGHYSLPTPIQCRGLRLASVVVPNSWRTVDNFNNKFFLVFANKNGIGPYYPHWTANVTLPVGNYNIVTLCAKLQELLNKPESWEPMINSPPEQSQHPFYGDLSITVSVGELGIGTIDPRVAITANHSYYKFGIYTQANSACKLLGFSTDRDINHMVSTIVADDLPRLNRISMINVCSQTLGSRLFDNWHSSFPTSSSIIYSVPVSGSFGQLFEYHNSAASQMAWFDDYGQSSQEIHSFDLSLTDENNRPIDLQGQSYYVNLVFMI